MYLVQKQHLDLYITNDKKGTHCLNILVKETHELLGPDAFIFTLFY